MTITAFVTGDDLTSANFNSRIQETNDEFSNRDDGTTAMASPNITSFANSQHNHQNNAGGGTLAPAALANSGGSEGDVPTVQSDGSVAWQGVGILPPGVILPYGGGSAPSGFLLCYGQAVSRNVYDDLFDVIGETYGRGNGTSTFNLPDLRGRLPVGLDNMGGTDAGRLSASSAANRAGTGGSERHTLTVNEMPAHKHGLNLDNAGWATGGTSYGPRTNNLNTRTYSGAVIRGHENDSGGWQQLLPTASTSSGSSRAAGYPMVNTGSGNSHNNMPPYIIIVYIIKT